MNALQSLLSQASGEMVLPALVVFALMLQPTLVAALQLLALDRLPRWLDLCGDRVPIIEKQPKQGLLAWLWAMVTDDARTSALYCNTKAWTAVPLKVHGRVFGVLRVDHQEPDYFDPQRSRLLCAVSGAG